MAPSLLDQSCATRLNAGVLQNLSFGAALESMCFRCTIAVCVAALGVLYSAVVTLRFED